MGAYVSIKRVFGSILEVKIVRSKTVFSDGLLTYLLKLCVPKNKEAACCIKAMSNSMPKWLMIGALKGCDFSPKEK